MTAERITISIDANLAKQLRSAAAEEQMNVSAFASDAIRRTLNHRGLAAVVADWEAEHGAFTDEELAEARRRLGW